jgi:hypothetical protein
MSGRRRPVDVLVGALCAAGGSVRTGRRGVRVTVPNCVPPTDRAFLTLVLRHLLRGEQAAPPMRRRRRTPT